LKPARSPCSWAASARVPKFPYSSRPYEGSADRA
jgi:hypothetical protein